MWEPPIVFIILNKAAINDQFLCFSIISSESIGFSLYLSAHPGKTAFKEALWP